MMLVIFPLALAKTSLGDAKKSCMQTKPYS